MKIKALAVKKSVRTGVDKVLNEYKAPKFETHYKSTIKEDFTCPYCSAHFEEDDDHAYMRETGDCQYCHKHVYYYTEYYWDMFFHAVGDDPMFFARRLESLFDFFEDPEVDCVEVPKFAKQVAFKLGMINAMSDVGKYMSGRY